MNLVSKSELSKTKVFNKEKFVIQKDKFTNVLFSKYKNKHILSYSKNKEFYLVLPSFIDFKISEKDITFFNINDDNNSAFSRFVYNLKFFLSNIKVLYTKRIRISGLGYKVLNEEGLLSFRLGYSKPIQMVKPYKLEDIIIKKKLLVIKSLDRNFLGNFSHFLIGLKKRDVYKGKGLSLEYKKRNLKPVKKK